MKKLKYFIFTIALLLIGSVFGCNEVKAEVKRCFYKSSLGNGTYAGNVAVATLDIDTEKKSADISISISYDNGNSLYCGGSEYTGNNGDCSKTYKATIDLKNTNECPSTLYYHHLSLNDERKYEIRYDICPNTWNTNSTPPNNNGNCLYTWNGQTDSYYNTEKFTITSQSYVNESICIYKWDSSNTKLVKDSNGSISVTLKAEGPVFNAWPGCDGQTNNPNDIFSNSTCPQQIYCNTSNNCKNPGWSLTSCDKTNQSTENNANTETNFSGKLIDDKTQEIIDWALNLIRIVGIILMIVLGMLDFIKATAAGNEEQVSKAKSSFVKRLIACVILFILPFIVNLLIDIVNDANGSNVIEKVAYK
ncbi:MAG: pilin [Clostridium sp.]|nr:pilin [Clostridium sp.]MCM1443855.1 pilin [Candidatus Amulumruptor caecigallinarius]